MNDFDYLAQLPGEERERAWMRERLETLSVREGIILAAAVQKEAPTCTADAINLIESLDFYGIVCSADSYEHLGEYYLGNCGGVPDNALPYVDLTQIGKYYTTLHPGQFVGGSYVAYPNIAAAPAYQGQDAPLPEDRGWTAKLKIASPAVPEGVWMRLPWFTGVGDYTSLEEEVTLKELHAQGWAECTLLDARCVVPEVGSLMEQYSDVGDLIGDSLCLDDALRWQVEDGQWYPAALRLENCQTLKLALDIAKNPNRYDWRPRSELKSAAVEALSESEISGNLIQTGGIDLCGYGAHLLEAQGYVLTEDGSGCIAHLPGISLQLQHPSPGGVRDGDAVIGGENKLNDFDYLAQLPGEGREQDWIRKRLETLSVREGYALSAAIMSGPPENAVQAINRLQSLDEYRVLLDAGSYEALGRRYLLNETRMPVDALPFADLEGMGQRYEDQHPGLFIGNYYVQYPEMHAQPVYWPGLELPTDGGWSVKLKLASPAVPEGVWLRLPGLDEYGDESSTEEALALRELQVKRWDECTLVDAQCVLPEAGDLTAQYNDTVSDLLYDGVELGFVLAQRGQGSPHFMERYAAALALEGCHDLRLALDISQNLNCYDWMQRADLEESGRRKLLDAGVTEEQIRASGIDLAGYQTHLLKGQGYKPTADGWGYIRRNANEFSYQFSTPAQPQEEPGMAMQ